MRKPIESLHHLTLPLRADARAAFLELLDAIYPPRCPVCGSGAMKGATCAHHDLAGHDPTPRCGRCAARISEHLPDGATCADCRATPPAFRCALALGDYRSGDGLRDWVLALKHRGRADLALDLGETLAELLRPQLAGEDLLVPVPLHPLRLFERGYDQALLLARSTARAAGLPVVRALRRARWTGPQGEPGVVSRQANVRDAFRPRRRAMKRLEGSVVWLVDDVLTSCATASECARVLKRMGAREVRVLVVARASSRSGGASDAPPT